jgi:ribose transport system substrate-binding protein
MKKRSMGLLSAGALVTTLALAACGSSSSSGSPAASTAGSSGATTTASGSTGETPPSASTGGGTKVGAKTLGLLYLLKNAEFSLRGGASTKEAAAAIGWKIVENDPNGDPQKAVSGLQSFVTQKVDGVLSAAWDSSAIKQPLQAAQAAKIPVVNVWAQVPESPLFTGQLGPSETDLGNAGADAFIKALPNGGQIAILNSNQFYFGSVRNKILKTKLTAAGNFKIVADHQTDYTNSQSDTTKAVTDILNANPKLVGIYADSSSQVPPLVTVLKSKGLCGKIQVVSYYGDLPNLAAIRDGCLSSLIDIPLQPLSWTTIDLLANYYANGVAMPKAPPASGYPFPVAQVVTITKANVPSDPTKYFDISYDYKSYFKGRWAKGEYGPTS